MAAQGMRGGKAPDAVNAAGKLEKSLGTL